MLLVNMTCGAGAVGIEQSVFGGDLDGGADRSDAELYGVLGRKSGVDFDEAVVEGEILLVNLEAIDAERKIAGDGESRVVGGEGAMELESVTGEIDGSLDGLAVRAGDFQAEFSGVALRAAAKSQEREREEENGEVEKWAHWLSGGIFMLTVSACRIGVTNGIEG